MLNSPKLPQSAQTWPSVRTLGVDQLLLAALPWRRHHGDASAPWWRAAPAMQILGRLLGCRGTQKKWEWYPVAWYPTRVHYSQSVKKNGVMHLFCESEWEGYQEWYRSFKRNDKSLQWHLSKWGGITRRFSTFRMYPLNHSLIRNQTW